MRLIDDSIMKIIRQYMLVNKETIAVSESVTAGLLQWSFSSVPDAAQFFQGGVTAYNLTQKHKHLAIDPVHAAEVNCVSQQVANEMAEHVCGLFNSEWGIGITGYASPVPESGGQLFAYYTIVRGREHKVMSKLTPATMDPTDVQMYYMSSVVKVFAQLLV